MDIYIKFHLIGSIFSIICLLIATIKTAFTRNYIIKLKYMGLASFFTPIYCAVTSWLAIPILKGIILIINKRSGNTNGN